MILNIVPQISYFLHLLLYICTPIKINNNQLMTSSDRHFLEQWKEQRSGPKWKYYLLYSVAWTVVSFLVIFFLTKLFTNLWETGGANLIYILIAISIVSGILSTHFTYLTSEKRYKKIVDREKGLLN